MPAFRSAGAHVESCDDTPPLKTAYAFEGILEDVAFMVGPAAVIAISAALFPTAGLLVGAVLYCIGALRKHL